jgi:hypothetical protein
LKRRLLTNNTETAFDPGRFFSLAMKRCTEQSPHPGHAHIPHFYK